MKGIILAGGSGTRLYPVTKTITKHLLPIYDKPMIYYPLSTLMLANINEVLIISTERDLPLYENLLGDGSKFGISLEYKVQEEPNGIAEAFIIGQEFIGDESVCLILGDNVFYGDNLSSIFRKAAKFEKGARIFGYPVKNPEQFGIVEFDEQMNVISIQEKPEHPKSRYAVPGIYFYDNDVVHIAKNIEPSDRGELEITTVNNVYLKNQNLSVEIFGRGVAWFDTGTHEGLLEASNFVEAVQKRQGLYIACLEEIAYRLNYIGEEELKSTALELGKTEYGDYLLQILEEENRYYSKIEG